MLHVIGNGETIYFLSNNEDETVVDFNKSTCSELIINLDSNEIQKINYLNEPSAIMSPIKDAKNVHPEEFARLKHYEKEHKNKDNVIRV